MSGPVEPDGGMTPERELQELWSIVEDANDLRLLCRCSKSSPVGRGSWRQHQVGCPYRRVKLLRDGRIEA